MNKVSWAIATLVLVAFLVCSGIMSMWYVYGLWPTSWAAWLFFTVFTFLAGLAFPQAWAKTLEAWLD